MSGKWLPGIDSGDASVICRRWFAGVCLDEMVDVCATDAESAAMAFARTHDASHEFEVANGVAVTVYVRAGHDAPVESFCVSGFWEPMYSVTLTDGDQHAD